jgi:hypothetical protein
MHPTHATKRTRAHRAYSDPGAVPLDQYHVEMQPINLSQQLVAQPSSRQDVVSPVTITLDSHTVPSTAILATAEATEATAEAATESTNSVPLQLRTQHHEASKIIPENREIPPEAVVETFSSSNPTERETQPPIDGTFAPGQVENPRGVFVRSLPTGTAPDPNIHSDTTEDVSSVQQDTTESPIGPTSGRVSADFSTLEGPAPDQEKFFQKYKTMLSLSDLEKFRTLIGRRRNYTARLVGNNFGGRITTPKPENPDSATRSGWTNAEWTHEHSGYEERYDDDYTLLIEDVDIRCLLALDAKFDLDPRFVISYAGPHLRTHQAETSTAGSWFTSVGTIEQDCSRQIDDWLRLRRMKRESTPTLSRRTKATSACRPWWQEDCRSYDRNFHRTVIACYCLSDKIRKSPSETVTHFSDFHYTHISQ